MPPRIATASDLVSFIEAQPEMIEVLRALAALDVPDAWIGAGFVRSPVWDSLHGRVPHLSRLADVDVLFFDADEPGREREHAIEAALAALRPGVPWSVRNQARMHPRNGDRPYRDTEDGMRHWLETATAVAARIRDGGVELLAPHGVEDLLGLVLRPTPSTAARPGHLAKYRQRVQAKGWACQWPLLRVLGMA